MRGFLSLVKADHDSAGGPGYWHTMLQHFFEAAQHWPGYGLDDFAKIDVPTLVLVGDRDEQSPVEDSVRAYRHLPQGQLCVLPDTQHIITRQGRRNHGLPWLGRSHPACSGSVADLAGVL
jgi:pimeloyl-ACP methyl ester carboxylesterase